MNIDDFNAVMQVNYSCDELPEGITVGVDIHADKTKEQIIEHIQNYTPYHSIERAINLKKGLSTSHIEELLHIEHDIEPPNKLMSEEDTLKMIEELLKKSE